MRISTLFVPIRKSARDVTLYVVLLLLSLSALSSNDRLLELTKDFPWKFLVEQTGSEKHDLLPGARSVDNTTLRTVQMIRADTSDESYVRIEYKNAMYSDLDTANIDYERLIAKTDQPDLSREWNIVLQAQNDLHWLQAECMMANSPPVEYFRQAYANLVSYVEGTGTMANRALLCDCDTQCKKVAIDR